MPTSLEHGPKYRCRKINKGWHTLEIRTNGTKHDIPRAVQTTHRTDPPGQTDRTQTVHRPIQLLQLSAVGPCFPKPIPTSQRQVFSSKTQSTKPDRTINGLKGISELTHSLSSSTLTLSSNDLSTLRQFADQTLRWSLLIADQNHRLHLSVTRSLYFQSLDLSPPSLTSLSPHQFKSMIISLSSSSSQVRTPYFLLFEFVDLFILCYLGLWICYLGLLICSLGS